jgi:ankyrin repeat protein
VTHFDPNKNIDVRIAGLFIGLTDDTPEAARGETLRDALDRIIDECGADLSEDARSRYLDYSETMQAYYDACREAAQAEASDSQDEANARQEKIRSLQARIKEITAFLKFSYPAERLFKAKDFEAFCAALPGVELDRLHGSTVGKLSPFPLIWAISAREKPLERVQLMLAAGARLDLATPLRSTVLHEMAAMNRKAAIRLPILRLLVFKGADLEALDIHGRTPLTIAVEFGSTEDVGHFLAAGSKVRDVDLKRAAQKSDKLWLLLEHVADDDETVRMAAGLGGWLRGEIAARKSCAEDAVKDGAKGVFHAQIVANLEDSLAMIAALPGYQEAGAGRKVTWQEEPAAFRSIKDARTLHDFRAALARVEIGSFDIAGDHPMYWPIQASEDRPEKLWLMLSAGASVKGARGNGEALHIFALDGRKDAEEQLGIARMLVQAGADVEARQYDGNTPLACAVAARHVVEAAALLELGANPNVTLEWGTMWGRRFIAPLLFAAAEDARVFRLLLGHGADTDCRDSEGRTLVTYLQSGMNATEAELERGNMSGNLMRHLKRSHRALGKSLLLLDAR